MQRSRSRAPMRRPRGRGGSGWLALLAAEPYQAPQGWDPSTGTGSLEIARGDDHIAHDGAVLQGEIDIFGHDFDAADMAVLEANAQSWSGGTWNGNSWSGNSWSGNSWSGNSWSGNSLVRRAIRGPATAGAATPGRAIRGPATAGAAIPGRATAGQATPGRAPAGSSVPTWPPGAVACPDVKAVIFDWDGTLADSHSSSTRRTPP